MKTKILILSLATSALINISSSFAKDFISSKKLQSSKNKKIEIYPVKFSDSDKKDCMDFNGACLLPLSKKPVVVLEDFKYQTFLNDKTGIKLLIDNKSSKSLKKATKKFTNENFAFVLDGRVIHAPSARSIARKNLLDIGLGGIKNFKSLLQDLNS